MSSVENDLILSKAVTALFAKSCGETRRSGRPGTYAEHQSSWRDATHFTAYTFLSKRGSEIALRESIRFLFEKSIYRFLGTSLLHQLFPSIEPARHTVLTAHMPLIHALQFFLQPFRFSYVIPHVLIAEIFGLNLGWDYYVPVPRCFF
jgi:hypothetical protein